MKTSRMCRCMLVYRVYICFLCPGCGTMHCPERWTSPIRTGVEYSNLELYKSQRSEQQQQKQQAPALSASARVPCASGSSSAPRSVAPSSTPCVLAPRYQPRERHLGCSTVHGQAPRRQDLWHRDVLHRRHESWRRPPGSKDEFKSLREPNVNFIKKNQIVKT